MANQFTETTVLECGRLSSEEAKAGNNENTSLWTNNLNDILKLDAGDQINVYGAFISERGAGQQSAIEISGKELGIKKTFSHINLSNHIPYTLNSTGYAFVIAEEKEDEILLRDDTLNFTMSYYIPSSAINSVQLPRRFVFSQSAATNYRENYTNYDAEQFGASITERRLGTTVFPDITEYYKSPGNSANAIPPKRLDKFRHKNERFTLLVREVTHFTRFFTDEFAVQDLRDPENAIYRTYKELKSFTIPKGFNSPEFIADEITRQFQAIVRNNNFTKVWKSIIERDVKLDDPIPISKILESETYKAFKAWNIFDGVKANFLSYFNLSTINGSTTIPAWTNGSGFQWLSQFQIVATKYPEIYETGRLINLSGSTEQGILGTHIIGDVEDTSLQGWKLNIDYNASNCIKFKNFFDAQALYPQIIDNLNWGTDTGFGYGNSIDNTRWLHCNRFANASMCLSTSAATLTNTQLGWGGYYQPRTGWNPPTAPTESLQSGLLCLYFDNTQIDTFYDSPDTENREEYSFGCLGQSSDGKILIYPARHIHNGVGTPAFKNFMNAIAGPAPQLIGIADGTKIGFDLHFNAPAMYYLSPMSGWGKTTDDFSSYSKYVSDYVIPEQLNNGTMRTPTLDIQNYKDRLYIGADNPSLAWDGTHFGFTGLHTGMNRGNKADAGNKSYSHAPFNTQEDVDASDTVYKINPPELYNDYTPDRCPYVPTIRIQASDKLPTPDAAPAIGGALYDIDRVNDNLEKWKIYDMLCGIFIEDYGVPESLWEDSLWGLLGFSYQQFNSTVNNRLIRIQSGNSNQLSKLTTNSEVVEGDTKIYSTNVWGIPFYNNMIASPTDLYGYNATGTSLISKNTIYPPIVHKTQSITILAENLPTRMIRGYYTIRSNILEGTPFIGGKRNNTQMPIIGVVDKMNPDGDFYFQQESSLTFTITKPLRLASISVSIHDPSGQFASTSNQSTVLFKITKNKATNFNIAAEFLKENKNNPLLKNL